MLIDRLCIYFAFTLSFVHRHQQYKMPQILYLTRLTPLSVKSKRKENKMESELLYRSEIRIPFPSAEKAELVAQVLSVDEELQPDRMLIEYTTEQEDLVVKLAAVDLKLLRTGVSSFSDMLSVAVRTILEFQDDV